MAEKTPLEQLATYLTPKPPGPSDELKKKIPGTFKPNSESEKLRGTSRPDAVIGVRG